MRKYVPSLAVWVAGAVVANIIFWGIIIALVVWLLRALGVIG